MPKKMTDKKKRSLPAKRTAAIAAAVTANTRPKRTAGGQTILPASDSNDKIVLAKQGVLTPAGQYYYELTADRPLTLSMTRTRLLCTVVAAPI